MRLKRGQPRESCDFCHRRKIKCDRSLREGQGFVSCSACSLRREACLLNDPGETRTRRRSRGNTHRIDTGSTPGSRELEITRVNISTGPHSVNCPVPTLSPAKATLSLQEHSSTFTKYLDDMLNDDFLGLSQENIDFLDQVFMNDNIETIGEAGQTPSSRMTEGRPAMGNHQFDDDTIREKDRGDRCSELDGMKDDPEMHAAFADALQCYFKFAAPWMPVLLEDAFWQDYHNGHCSDSLVLAVACRGMPFIDLADKWSLQQRFACSFRKAFLDAQSEAHTHGKIRLDDLEALALMLNFDYDDSAGPPLHSNLGNLFLSHESLVMMTVQSTIQDCVAVREEFSVILAKARERRVLLYWHIYGFDAFHCLDRQVLSLIPATEINDENQCPPHEASEFFGALLNLATIVRKILQQLCNRTAKRAGIKPADVNNAYAQVFEWRDQTCPPHLRRYERVPGVILTQDDRKGQSFELTKHIQLHRAVLWALEINCLMHIENCVSKFGIKGDGDMQAEITVSRVEYETLRAVNDMVAVCHWIISHEIHDDDGKQFSLIDLAPLALRNVCAGTCFWLCQHGIRSRQSLSKNCFNTIRRSPIDAQQHSAHAYAKTAKLLRNAAAQAVSHRDTIGILERLDKQIALLTAEVGSSEEIGR